MENVRNNGVSATVAQITEPKVNKEEVKSLIMAISASTMQNDFTSKKLVAKVYNDLLTVNPEFKKDYVKGVKEIVTATLDNDYVIKRIKKLCDLAHNMDKLRIGIEDSEQAYRCKIDLVKIHLYNIEELVKILKRIDQIRAIEPEIRKEKGISLKKARNLLAEISAYCEIEGKTDYNNSLFGVFKDMKQFLKMVQDDLEKADKLFKQAQKLSIEAKKELLKQLQAELKGV